MPTEKKEPKHPRLNNKANRARHEKENQQIRILKIAGIAVFGLIALTLIFGGLFASVIRPNKVLAKVNDHKVTVSDFEKTVRYRRSQLIDNYEYMRQLYQSFGIEMDEATRSQYENQLQPEYASLIGSQVYTTLIDQYVLEDAAKEAGFTVSDAEIDARMESLFGYFPNGTPTPEPTELPFAETATPSEEQLKLLNYTATPEPTEIPAENDLEGLGEEGPMADGELTLETAATAVPEGTSEETTEDADAEPVDETAEPGKIETETTEPTADDAANEETVEEPVASEEEATANETAENDALEAGAETEAPEETAETATPEPTATVYTEEMYKKNSDEYFASNEYADLEFQRKLVFYELLGNKVRDDIEKTVAREEEMVWARHILVATEEEANAVLERLNNGEDWNAVAFEVSTDTSNAQNGGDLGWFGKGRMVAPFEEAAFAQEVGTISNAPVQSDFGYHIIQIIGHEIHPLTSSEYSSRLDAAYTKWIDDHKAEMNVKSSDDWQNYVPTEPTLPYNTVQF